MSKPDVKQTWATFSGPWKPAALIERQTRRLASGSLSARAMLILRYFARSCRDARCREQALGRDRLAHQRGVFERASILDNL